MATVSPSHEGRGAPTGRPPDRVRAEPVLRCPVCQTLGETLYPEVKDRVWTAPGTYAYLRCAACGMIWLHPRPVPADVPLLYPTDPSEARPGTGRGASWFDRTDPDAPTGGDLAWAATGPVDAGSNDRRGHLMDRFLPWRKEAADRAVMHIRGPPDGILLDVGCGEGSFLAHMRELGWRTLGIEVEPRIAARARIRYGLDTLAGRLEALPLRSGSVQVITMHHVLDHLHDPAAALRSCRDALAPRGRLIVVSPNGEGEGHLRFRDAWVNLDPPRHLHIFSPGSLRRVVEEAGLTIQVLETSALRATAVHFLSSEFRRTGRFPSEESSWKVGPSSRWFGAYERLIRAVRPSAGEEILLVASR